MDSLSEVRLVCLYADNILPCGEATGGNGFVNFQNILPQWSSGAIIIA
ncbi:hypothetical protein CLV98_106218 [Dyadobacter jejuensis]|uniref:Uncharacterized protein n=1 Tax=Dyadobacter jejuensis TaxID=1082580 RepID=A0A316AJ75_9BACT|nr:hypothetical protein CLV98_106218 [Dyadobacter jejuensis]